MPNIEIYVQNIKNSIKYIVLQNNEIASTHENYEEAIEAVNCLERNFEWR